MQTPELTLDALGRVHELIPAVLDGLSLEDISWRPDPEANSIGWLLWHLIRVEDGIIAGLAGSAQVWVEDGWHERFGLPYPADAAGFGMTSDDVGHFQIADPALLTQYAARVAERSTEVVSRLSPADFDTVIDTSYTPAVTMGARLVSLIVETSQHIGQVGYLKGLRERAVGQTSGWHGYV